MVVAPTRGEGSILLGVGAGWTGVECFRRGVPLTRYALGERTAELERH